MSPIPLPLHSHNADCANKREHNSNYTQLNIYILSGILGDVVCGLVLLYECVYVTLYVVFMYVSGGVIVYLPLPSTYRYLVLGPYYLSLIPSTYCSIIPCCSYYP